MTPRSKPRIVALIAAAAALACVISACSSPDGQSSSDSGGSTPATVNVLWFGTQKAGFEAILPAFEKSHPNIKINMRYVNSANQYFSQVPTLFAAGNPADITGLLPGTGQTLSVIPYAEKGQLAQISGPWTETVPNELKPLGSIDGKYYAYTPTIGLFVLAYNQDLFEQYGLTAPKTVAQVIAACRRATAEGKVGFAVPGGEPAQLFNLVTAMSGSVFLTDPDWISKRKDGSVTFAGTAGWRTALQQLVDMKDAGCFQTGAAGTTVAQTTAMFASEKALMMSAYANTFSQLGQVNAELRFGFLPMPAQSAQQDSVLLNPGISFVVADTSTVKEAAQTFINFIAEPENIKRYSEGVGLPSVSEVTQKQLPQAFSELAPALNAGRTYAAPTNAYWNTLVYQAGQENVVGLLTGQRTIDDVLKAMDEAWDKGAGATS